MKFPYRQCAHSKSYKNSLGCTIMTSIPLFKCCSCGRCCSQIRGFTSESERQFIEEYGYGKLPLIQLVPPQEMTFPLWDFEAKRFKEYEKEFNIDAQIKPSRGVFDLNSNRFIVFTYQMNTQDACPFLEENGKCIAYKTKRAFICHLFPLNRSPYLKLEENNYEGLFGSCHTLDQFKEKFNLNDKKTLIRQLHQSLGDSLLNAIQHDYIMEWSNNIIIELMKQNKIKPAVNHPYQFLKKRIQNSEHMDLTEFLIEVGFKTREEINQLIQNFETLTQAKEILREDKIII